MNKWQIICPVAAMLLVALAAVCTRTYKNSRQDNTLATASLALDAITRHTNFDLIANPTPALKSNIFQFLAAPVKRTSVRSGPQGEGKRTAIVTLQNDNEEEFEIELRWIPTTRTFEATRFGLTTNSPASTR